jgi:hypothetical protein
VRRGDSRGRGGGGGGGGGGAVAVQHSTYASRVRLVCGTPAFWSIAGGNLLAVGSGIYVVSCVADIVADLLVHGPASSSSSPPATVMNVGAVLSFFSLANGASNLATPLVADWLHVRGWLRKPRFVAWVMVAMAAAFGGLAAVDFRYGEPAAAASATASPAQGVDADAPLPSPPAALPLPLQRVAIALLALTGFGYGTFLTLFPSLMADAFGTRHMGTLLALMQLGTVVFAFAVPPAAASAAEALGSWRWVHVAVAGMLLVGAAALGGPRAPSHTFGRGITPPPSDASRG